jgi:hypothetical protein
MTYRRSKKISNSLPKIGIYFHKIKDYLHTNSSPLYSLAKCSFENIGTSLTSFWLYHNIQNNNMKYAEINLGVSQ